MDNIYVNYSYRQINLCKCGQKSYNIFGNDYKKAK